jgi:hypothetical protein
VAELPGSPHEDPLAAPEWTRSQRKDAPGERERLVREAKRLRAEGVSFKTIAATLHIAAVTAAKYVRE